MSQLEFLARVLAGGATGCGLLVVAFLIVQLRAARTENLRRRAFFEGGDVEP